MSKNFSLSLEMVNVPGCEPADRINFDASNIM